MLQKIKQYFFRLFLEPCITHAPGDSMRRNSNGTYHNCTQNWFSNFGRRNICQCSRVLPLAELYDPQSKMYPTLLAYSVVMNARRLSSVQPVLVVYSFVITLPKLVSVTAFFRHHRFSFLCILVVIILTCYCLYVCFVYGLAIDAARRVRLMADGEIPSHMLACVEMRRKENTFSA